MNQQQVAIVVKLIRELGKALEAASMCKGKLTTEVREVLETAIGMFESTLADILNPDGTLTADLIRRAVFGISEITWSIDFNLHDCDIDSDNSDHHFRTGLMMVKTAKELRDGYSYCAPPPIMKVIFILFWIEDALRSCLMESSIQGILNSDGDTGGGDDEDDEDDEGED